MRVAVIDIGSYTVKLSVFDTAGRDFFLVRKESRVCELISRISGGRMRFDGFATLASALSAFKRTADGLYCDKVCAFATASLRRASNSSDVIAAMRRLTGLSIDLLPAEKEAEYSFRAVLNRTVRGEKTGAFSDMGGGSTEIVLFRDGKPFFLTSLPFGCLSLYKGHCKSDYPDPAEWEEMRREAAGALEKQAVPENAGKTLYLIGGSARALAALYRHAKEISGEDDNGFAMTLEQMRSIPSLYGGEKRSELRALFPERHKMILPAAAAYEAITERLGAEKIVISSSGMREGYLLSLLDPEGS